MRWAAHFWDVDRWSAKFPYVFEEYYFRRWIAACHLYKTVPPALPRIQRGARSSVCDAQVLELARDRNEGYVLTDRLLDGERPELRWP